MPWETVDLKKLAKDWGVNQAEVEEKHKLIKTLIKKRKDANISQAELAKRAGVSQGRIAQIESRIGTKKVTFDVLFKLLGILGYEAKIVLKKTA